MNIIIDIIFLAIIIITAYICSKYGFIRTLIELVGFILIVIIADKVSMPIANGIYDVTIQKQVTVYADDVKNNTAVSADEFVSNLPKIVTENRLFKIDENALIDKYNSYISNGTREAILKVNDDLIRPMVIRVLSMVVSLVIFILLNFIVVFIARFVNGIVKHSFAKGLNEKLGFLFGIPKGILIVFVICVVIIALTSLTQKGLWIFTLESINKSYTINFVRQFLPKFNMFSIFYNSSTIRSLLF